MKKTFYFKIQDAGHLVLTGEDRAVFLQRQTTNDIRSLVEGQLLETVLTNPEARILDLLTLFSVGDEIHIFPLPGRGQETYQYLRKRIFFNDKVRLQDQSAAYAHFMMVGEVVGLNLTDLEGWVLPLPAPTDHVRIVVPAAHTDECLERLSRLGVVEISAQDYDLYRVLHGIPGPVGELTSAYTPLEIPLGHAISSTKGCYTGQEIIARQVSYDKITRRMVGFRADGVIATGDKIKVEGKSAGTVTSAVQDASGQVGLAVVKKPFDQDGTAISIITKGGEIQGRVVELPFPT